MEELIDSEILHSTVVELQTLPAARRIATKVHDDK
jgi:hypothetical protein